MRGLKILQRYNSTGINVTHGIAGFDGFEHEEQGCI
jgi:hypothetical protein